MPSVRSVFYDVLRRYKINTIFGNPGSTEQHMLASYPADFRYVLALHEASAISMAEGYASNRRKPALINVHSIAGTGNAMGHLAIAFNSAAPLLLIAGQQERAQVLHEPYLTNIDPWSLVRPYVKWAYQPVRAQDVPGAVVRALNTALQPPQGPVYLSIPSDDWQEEYVGTERNNVALSREVSTKVGPDPGRLAEFLDLIRKASKVAIVYGAGVERSEGFEEATTFAELTDAAVFHETFPERCPSPRTHPNFRRMLPPGKGLASKALEGYDVVLSIGADAFRYYPYVSGDFLPEGTRVLQVVDNPESAARAAVGDSLLCDPALFLKAAIGSLETVRRQPPNRSVWDRVPVPLALDPIEDGLEPGHVFRALSVHRPKDCIVVNESVSAFGKWHEAWLTFQPDSYFMMSGGQLGWALPASVGIAMAEREKAHPREILCMLGDGSIQYSIQSLWNAAQLNLKIIFVVINNSTYAILHQFSTLKKLDNVPGLELPGIDVVSISKGYGVPAVRVNTVDGIQEAFKAALDRDGPSLIEVTVNRVTTGVPGA